MADNEYIHALREEALTALRVAQDAILRLDESGLIPLTKRNLNLFSEIDRSIERAIAEVDCIRGEVKQAVLKR